MRAVLAVFVMGLALMEAAGSTEAPQASQARAANATNRTAEKGSVSTGPATELTPFANVPSGCTTPGVNVQPDVFPIMIGVVQSEDGKRWTVPAPVHDGPVAVDLYNNCTGPGDNPNYLSQLKTAEVDPDGVEITGYIHADNYFELYVNGKFVARDSLPMTPFNTSVVRFKAKYPMTYAIMGVDWETHQGVGMEYAAWNIGDAGFIAYFSDGNGTHNDWRAETFYIAPLDNPDCVRTAGGRDSSFCSQVGASDVRSERPKDLQGAPLADSRCLDVGALRRFALAEGHHLVGRRSDEPAGVHRLHEVFRGRRVHLDA